MALFIVGPGLAEQLTQRCLPVVRRDLVLAAVDQTENLLGAAVYLRVCHCRSPSRSSGHDQLRPLSITVPPMLTTRRSPLGLDLQQKSAFITARTRPINQDPF
jgi:hypothetical protein